MNNIDKNYFRNAMSNLGAAVSIVTTDGKDGPRGLTVSAVCSVTDTPPTLLVCLNRSNRSYEQFIANGNLCVNVLARGHEMLSGLFASSSDSKERFQNGDWSTLHTGAPVLNEAIASFDCKIINVSEVGSHGVLYSAVKAIKTGPQIDGLAYFRRSYCLFSA
mgnify:CR=1 FL=1